MCASAEAVLKTKNGLQRPELAFWDHRCSAHALTSKLERIRVTSGPPTAYKSLETTLLRIVDLLPHEVGVSHATA